MATTEIIKAGSHTFKITENSMKYQDRIISHTFKIGGDYEECVTASYSYRDGTPISAKLLHLLYEPECSIGSDLQRGIGSELMIKTLLRYVYKKINIIPIFSFDDMSHIDCVEKDVSKPPPRKMTQPLHLAFFSIAYNDKTWYEKRFHATMANKAMYEKYRARISFLTDTSQKMPFARFLEIAQPPAEQIELLERYYISANTYRDFFNVIPFKDRCNILRPWLEPFMTHYLKDVFTNSNWEIDVRKLEAYEGGGSRRTRKLRDQRKSRKLVPINYRFIHYKPIHAV
jgi:hypothetical protein